MVATTTVRKKKNNEKQGRLKSPKSEIFFYHAITGSAKGTGLFFTNIVKKKDKGRVDKSQK